MNWFRDFILPRQASTNAAGYDTLFMFITGLAIFFFVIVAGMLALFVLRYRRRGPDEVTPHMTHNFSLELVWSIVPLLLVIVIFFWGFHGFMTAADRPGRIDGDQRHRQEMAVGVRVSGRDALTQ